MPVLFKDLKKALTEELNRFRNRHFLRAAMAASALLATADGEVQISELLARDYILENIKELAVYDVHKAVDMFRSYADFIQKDSQAGKTAVYELLVRFSGDALHATLLVRAAVLIAKADGNFNEPEKNLIAEMCHRLKIDADQTICTALPA